jgi:hypothetical protein
MVDWEIQLYQIIHFSLLFISQDIRIIRCVGDGFYNCDFCCF